MKNKIRSIFRFCSSVCMLCLANKIRNHAVFMTSEETIKDLIDNSKSFIRFGDGEFEIISKNDIHYQKYDLELSMLLEKIIYRYLNENNDKYLVGMPGKYFVDHGISKKNTLELRCWSKSLLMFRKKYNFPVLYGDAFLFGKGKEEKYKYIWMNEKVKQVIFVHNSKLYADIFAEKYGLRTFFVKVPKENAFYSLNDILNGIRKLDAYEKLGTQILVSAGPAGKIICYRLCCEGAWAIDTGHCWDDPLTE